MIKSTGIIIDKKSDSLKVQLEGEACATCGSNNECPFAHIGIVHIIEVPLFENAEKGDRVELEIEEKKIFFLSVLFYLLPSILIIVFALAGSFIFKSDFITAVLALFGVLFSLLIIYIIDKKKKNSFKHKIKRLLK
ncbi:MAG: hypothetical protein COX48_04990 [bacterium (Candidatus Stahlbacteria) CG23_combo_of_CG06-09_8_20_14_all_34_7]|nr:MAG: hypothetical protein COX48_04990 [bacterium (Candidatus Stahlbacteria) CG23_combo_of_CG06-09_8_20_14_all_34_7]